MSARRTRLAQRLARGVADVVGERAPWLSDQAYRAVAGPLQWVDPEGGARTAEARLDDIRDRVAVMAATGRIRRSEQRRIERDLARTGEDLERIAPRLPAVQARALTLRLTSYTQVLASLSASPVPPGRAARVRDAAVLTGTAGASTGLLLTVAAAPMAVAGGVAAGVLSTAGVTMASARRARQERIGALVTALSGADEQVRGPAGVNLRDLDRDRRALIERAVRSGRLDPRGDAILHMIDAHLDTLLVRLMEGDLEAQASHLVQATVTRYLPDTLVPLLELQNPHALVRGRPAAEEVADQLMSIEGGLAEAAKQPTRDRPETQLHLQGEFLRSKFGRPSL